MSVVVLVVLVPALSPNARADSAAGGPTCYFPSYAVHIFKGKAYISDSTVNTYYYDGNTYQITHCTRVPTHSLQAVLSDSNYQFYEWNSATGYFTDTGTTYSLVNPTAFSSAWGSNAFQGGFATIISEKTGYIWGGYVEASQAGGDNYYAHTQFTIPTASALTFVGSAPSDQVGAWVGLGGYHSSTLHLWQAGVEIQLVSGQSPTMYPFYQAWPTMQNAQAGPQQVTPGDTITAAVCFDPYGGSRCVSVGLSGGACTASGGCDYYSVADQHSHVFAGVYYNFVPDTSTAEFVTEMPGNYPAPGGASFTFSHYGSILFPAWIGPFARETDQNFGCGMQTMSAGPIYPSGTFAVSATSC